MELDNSVSKREIVEELSLFFFVCHVFPFTGNHYKLNSDSKMKRGLNMDQATFVKAMKAYLKLNPTITWDQFQKMARQAYVEAQKSTIPDYDPIKVKLVNTQNEKKFSSEFHPEETRGVDDSNLIGDDGL